MSKSLYFLDAARSEDQRRKMLDLESRGVCVMCLPFIKKESIKQNPVLYENEGWLVSKNDYPYEGSRFHFLISAKRHIELPTELYMKEWAMLGKAINWVERAFKIKGASLVMRFGDGKFTQSSIQHLHAHIIVGVARDKNDPNAESIKVSIGTKGK